MISFSRIFIKCFVVIFVFCLLINADESERKKMRVDLTKTAYTPRFNIDSYASYKGKSIFVSDVESEDKKAYYSDDNKIRYYVDNLEDYFENWIKIAFEHTGLLVQEPMSFWQRAFQPSINVSVNQAQGMAPNGMLDFKVKITKYSESNSEVIITGYVDGRIAFQETIPVAFPKVPETADKEFLINNAFTNLDIMAAAILNNPKFHEYLEATNK